MNPLSKPPLWTRTVHVGYIPLPPAWRPGTVASHYQKLAAPLVGTAVLSSSVGDIFIVPMAVAWRSGSAGLLVRRCAGGSWKG